VTPARGKKKQKRKKKITTLSLRGQRSNASEMRGVSSSLMRMSKLMSKNLRVRIFFVSFIFVIFIILYIYILTPQVLKFF